jgi:Mrp family chromosome partitioning ATPase
VTKIYEALSARNLPSEAIAKTPSVTLAMGRTLLRRDELVSLYQAIESALPEGARRVVEMISATPGEGTSTIVRELAHAVATAVGRRVLVLTVLLPRANGHAREDTNLNDVLERGLELTTAVRQAPGMPFQETTLWATDASGRYLFDPDWMEELFSKLAGLADITFIDAPAALSGFAGIALARQASGVIMVVEAERTRSPIVDQARRSIESNGGRMLGVVLNKRRFHIPRFLYQWL